VAGLFIFAIQNFTTTECSLGTRERRAEARLFPSLLSGQGGGRLPGVTSLFRFTAGVVLFATLSLRAEAQFTSLYVFGDGMCTTTNNISGYPYYYGNRYCNGRVWVEVLAQWQGLAYNSNKNWSYFGHYSPKLLANLTNFTAPDLSTALVAVWVNDADFVGFLSDSSFRPYDLSNIAKWTNAINQSLSNHQAAIQMLYAKGTRTLLTPNAVDLTQVPNYAGLSAANKSFIRQRTMDFNTRFNLLLSNATTTLPGLKVHAPDAFQLLDDVHSHPASYEFTNVTSNCVDDGHTALNGPAAALYAFWDYLNPTAKCQMILADRFQQLISPVKFSGATALGNTNRLELIHVPAGRGGVLEASTNLLNWATDQNITSTNTSQSLFVPASEPQRFYRARFPLVWTWP
jgi:phospholipase/lecithinase/hemolysin